jgi:anti-sigma-K factor RskA
MNPVDDKSASVDARARQLHAASLSRLSPQTLSRLRAARHAAHAGDAPVRAGHWRWLTASAFTAVFAVGIGVQLMSSDPAQPAPGEPPAGAVFASAAPQDAFGDATVLDEDPDLYLWLASAEAQPLAVESTP